jgi:hypothetical protein
VNIGILLINQVFTRQFYIILDLFLERKNAIIFQQTSGAHILTCAILLTLDFCLPKMFRAAINDLFATQRLRISKALCERTMAAALATLDRFNLNEECIDRECMLELAIVLNKKYDTEVTSGRLDNYGWSTAHIRDHMHRFLQSKMRAVGEILKVYVREGLEASDDSIQDALRDLTTSRKPYADSLVSNLVSNLEDLDEA